MDNCNNQSPFLDNYDSIEVSTGGNLPHWHKDGIIQYVTFRRADSLPQEKIKEMKEHIDIFKKNKPEPWNNDQNSYNNT